jgi:hypothetical protein
MHNLLSFVQGQAALAGLNLTDLAPLTARVGTGLTRKVASSVGRRQNELVQFRDPMHGRNQGYLQGIRTSVRVEHPECGRLTRLAIAIASRQAEHGQPQLESGARTTARSRKAGG